MFNFLKRTGETTKSPFVNEPKRFLVNIDLKIYIIPFKHLAQVRQLTTLQSQSIIEVQLTLLRSSFNLLQSSQALHGTQRMQCHRMHGIHCMAPDD